MCDDDKIMMNRKIESLVPSLLPLHAVIPHMTFDLPFSFRQVKGYTWNYCVWREEPGNKATYIPGNTVTIIMSNMFSCSSHCSDLQNNHCSGSFLTSLRACGDLTILLVVTYLHVSTVPV